MDKIASMTLNVMNDIAKNTKMSEVNYADTLAFLKGCSRRTKKHSNMLTKNGRRN